MSLPTCRVDWRALSAVIDSDDPDRDPDAAPLAHLSVKFTAGRTRIVTTSPPETVFLHPIEWVTDEDGYLVSPDGQRGLYLVASDIDPENVWTWTVRISSTPHSPHQITAVSYAFVAPSGGSIDLSTVIPVPAAPGRELPAWQEVAGVVESARDEALLARDETVAARDDIVVSLTGEDSAVAHLLTDEVSATHTALRTGGRIVAAGPPRAAGMMCFTWDDGYANWLSIAQAAYNRGQRHTFCVQTNRIGITGGITAADILAIHEMGHEIASHSVTHANHAASTVAQRVVEYDQSKATLEAIIGAPVTTYVYPVGGTARNNATDCEAWGRYARLRDTSQTGWTPIENRVGPFLIPSIAWVRANVLDSIRRCAVQPMIYNVFAHNPDGLIAGVPDITMTQAIEAMDLAQSLGVPCVTMRDAYPGGGLVTSPTLSGSLGAWRTVGDAGAVTVVPIVNPPTGYADTHVVRVTTTTTQFSGIRELIPVTPGRTYVIAYAGRLGVNGAGGTLATGTVYARFGKSIDYAGAVSGWDADSAFTDHTQALNTSLGDKSGAWVRMGGKFTIPEGRRFMEVQIGVTGEAGVTAEFTHIWVGEERYGVFA